jgi:hypothetical protein
MKHSLFFTIALLLMFTGNLYALYNLLFRREKFKQGFPGITSKGLSLLTLLPLLIITALAGIWYWQLWGVWLLSALALIVIVFDVYYKFWPHLVTTLAGLVLMAWLIGQSWAYYH